MKRLIALLAFSLILSSVWAFYIQAPEKIFVEQGKKTTFDINLVNNSELSKLFYLKVNGIINSKYPSTAINLNSEEMSIAVIELYPDLFIQNQSYPLAITALDNQGNEIDRKTVQVVFSNLSKCPVEFSYSINQLKPDELTIKVENLLINNDLSLKLLESRGNGILFSNNIYSINLKPLQANDLKLTLPNIGEGKYDFSFSCNEFQAIQSIEIKNQAVSAINSQNQTSSPVNSVGFFSLGILSLNSILIGLLAAVALILIIVLVTRIIRRGKGEY